MQASDLKSKIDARAFYHSELPDAPEWPKGKSAWVDGGKCVFHSDNNPGSFRVNLGTGGFICFSCMAKGGSIVDFTMQRHGLSFIEAVRKLRRDWGV